MNKIVVLSSLLFLTACDPFEGTISVKENMIIKSTEKSPGCSPEDTWGCEQIVKVNVPVGDHSGKMDFIGRDQIQLTLKINGKKKTMTLNLPKKINIPSSGNFEISAADLGQDFGAQGVAATQVTDSELRRGQESCTYQRPETVCTPQGCYTEYRTVWGYQTVEYFDRHTDQQINVNFQNNQSLLATFAGQRNFNERIYRYKGQCF